MRHIPKTLDGLDSWFAKESKKLLQRRFSSLPGLVRVAFERESAEGIFVPGEFEHKELVRRLAEAAWQWGFFHGEKEVERKGGNLAFNEPGLPPGMGPPPRAAIAWASARTVLQGKWNRDLDALVTSVIVNGLQTGATNFQVMAALDQVLPSFSKARLENIARTESSAAYTQGRLAMFRGSGGGVPAVQFVAIMDDRVTEICASRNGKIMRVDSPELIHNTPPLHYQCRSTLVPVTMTDWIALEEGDPDVEDEYFGWVPEGHRPASLSDASSGWDKVKPPLDGFGGLK